MIAHGVEPDANVMRDNSIVVDSLCIFSDSDKWHQICLVLMHAAKDHHPVKMSSF